MTTTADTFAAINAGDAITLTLTDGTTLIGEFVGVTAKGATLMVDGKSRTCTLAKIAGVAAPEATTPAKPEKETPEDMTTAEVADIFEIPAKELRKATRAMGLGVARGRRYYFSEDDVKAISKHLAQVEVEAKAAAEEDAKEAETVAA
ncbi:helix-turn-helix domain-containing protein [Catellatospora sp. NPDC049609]|uniref:helix-turn-helix domain-containing protein n=1 Tax=Catellatospora sp. NPDC049609 TaxID=3155505 RepID=UPI0034188025